MVNHEQFMALVAEFKATKVWDELEMTNEKLARLLGIGERTIYRWYEGKVRIPMTAILLLKHMLKDQGK